MGIKGTKNGKLLYHLTDLDNLDSILDHGLVPRKYVIENSLKFNDVADEKIITKRTLLGLDDFIPFHFHPYSAFDVDVKNTNSNKDFIYICIKRDLAIDNNFKILPMHPLSLDECQLLNYHQGFDNIDWDTMHTLGTDDKYSRHVKMAECLTDLIVPPSCFHCIYVKDEETKKLVEDKLNQREIKSPPPYVNVQKWF